MSNDIPIWVPLDPFESRPFLLDDLSVSSEAKDRTVISKNHETYETRRLKHSKTGEVSTTLGVLVFLLVKRFTPDD
jgi:hypothetical protein